MPLLYGVCAVAAMVGGAIHPPTNHDALSYRVPRVLHWLEDGRWHWIGGADPRMDFSGIGFEVLTLPPFGALQSLRFAFLPNSIGYLLLPGLVFSVLAGLGVRKRIASRWMWVVSCGSCFVMQAGSIGNDLAAGVMVLAAIAFALRARESGRRFDLVLAVLAAAAMTGFKANTLPLLLPAGLCVLAALVRWPRRIVTLCIAGLASLPVTFVPVALANLRFAGDWTGMPDSPLKIHDPTAGLAGNAILIGSGSLVPAVLPQAGAINDHFDAIAATSLRWIKEAFVDFRMTHPQLASEENSGVGLGVTAALLLALCVSLRELRAARLRSLGGLVFAGFWVALVFYMAMLGNCGAPRLVLPYYVGLSGLPLLLMSRGRVFDKRWWRVASFVLLLPILPALFCSPARPLLPMRVIVDNLVDRGVRLGVLERLKTVYDVYADRHDSFREVRELLPADASRIAFAGTSADSEYSFWLPLGSRSVTDFLATADGALPDTGGFDAVVASKWGTRDRFGMTPQELAGELGWELSKSVEVRPLASMEPVTWWVILPPDDRSSDRP